MRGGLNGCASDCRPFTGKCGNAVLSFPVCNYLKSLAGVGSPTGGRSSTEEQQHRAWPPERPLAEPRMCGIYFLSGNMTHRFHQRRRSHPSLTPCRKERRSMYETQRRFLRVTEEAQRGSGAVALHGSPSKYSAGGPQ